MNKAFYSCMSYSWYNRLLLDSWWSTAHPEVTALKGGQGLQPATLVCFNAEGCLVFLCSFLWVIFSSAFFGNTLGELQSYYLVIWFGGYLRTLSRLYFFYLIVLNTNNFIKLYNLKNSQSDVIRISRKKISYLRNFFTKHFLDISKFWNSVKAPLFPQMEFFPLLN